MKTAIIIFSIVATIFAIAAIAYVAVDFFKDKNGDNQ
jgi:hypothetical protein